MADDYAGDTTTTATIAIGETVTGNIETIGDEDWFSIGLTAGQTIQVSLIGGSLFDPYVYIYDASGTLLTGDDDISWPTNPDSLLEFTASTSGVYYISATRYQWDSETSEYYPNLGSYSLTVTEQQEWVLSPTTNPLLMDIDWGTQVGSQVIDVFFAPNGFSADGYTSEGFNAYELQQFAAVFDLIETFTNLTINVATTETDAEFVVLLDTDEVNGSFLGYFNPPGEDNQGVGVFDGSSWDRAAGGDLEQGGDGWYTIVHEFLHGLGLAHPHDTGGTSTVMDGVSSAFNDYGTWDLNQGVFTIMSYNAGWFTGPAGTTPDPSGNFGELGGPMAIDIAALQENYGANGNTNSGDNTYTLPTTNASGTFFACIWDTGGTDEIVHTGAMGANIDLRAATITEAVGGGGWVSHADGIAGGFTIAQNVVIENASGSTGNDTITGNDVSNNISGAAGRDTLIGNGGRDTLNGGGGHDSIDGGDGNDRVLAGDGFDTIMGGAGIDYLLGNAGNDRIFGGDDADLARGGTENDVMFGDGGNDTLLGEAGFDRLDGGDDDDLLNGGGQADNLLGRGGNDTLLGGDGFDRLFGGIGDDDLRGNDGNDGLYGNGGRDTINGGAGDDRIYGGGGFDRLIGDTGNDQLSGNLNADIFVFADGHGNDTIRDFEEFNDAEDIDFSGVSALNSFAQVLAASTQVGTSVVISTGGGNSVTLFNVDLADLDANDFAF